MSVHRLDAVVNKKTKKIKSWRHQIAGQSIMSELIADAGPALAPSWLPRFARAGLTGAVAGIMDAFDVQPMLEEGAQQAYDIEVDTELYQQASSIPVTFWRSVGNSHNGFTVEDFLDRICVAIDVDPVDYRLQLLHKNERAKKVVEKVAAMSNWRNHKPSKTRALGLAYHFSYKSYVAEVADVEIVGNQIIVHNVYAAIDCGRVINPHIVEKQMRSGIVLALSAELKSKISFKDGVIEQSNFDGFQVTMLGETPNMEIAIIPSDHNPTGVGEPGFPPLIPALSNAIYRINGKRFDKTPFRLDSAQSV